MYFTYIHVHVSTIVNMVSLYRSRNCQCSLNLITLPQASDQTTTKFYY